ncbi:DUF179 domain-containing protein [Actinobacillus succinogenes]|nr:YqgE/AlgH family protein [Actinobacillus succinogenes]PHI41219.1 DUF179 domain-containing protein [Actinobacillus succinogenes]
MNLQNQLLVAMPNLEDDYFSRAVIYICEHTEQGTMGLVINQPTDLSITELAAKVNFMMKIDRTLPNQAVLAGGPVNVERGFILHTPIRKPLQHSYRITDRLSLTTSADIIETFGSPDSPEKYLVVLGCAAWVPGQLEQEIGRNDWLVVPADDSVLFDTPYEQRWLAAQKLLGFESYNLSDKAGRA